ncbi:class I SAM-dependent methyltransferase [Streptomyces spectabilis]|uniref:Methyltransferase domain-containing protein n=1 Tax=Streptomyces spectabilis TaxID=68270 RepID=A0A5P2X4F7_STRST|nr:methyltransferase domain-containing protein [Streptomyces spectabilis]MBB5101406.1 SAM-dependent methyltransferase [Streptomyces spectabilis]MCI3900601.1 methyltransferase domain-containing protein [Streptomyces spectabilis]QEV58159.1 methyltransferase domain-containing protein [Streptomyces spectabilis]GGV11200.1 methyltransferase [Streptomyces spectabilis]
MHGIANTAQAQAWNGYEGAHWAAHQDRWNAVNGGFDRPLLDAAALRAGEHVLDVGCGAGATTRLAARAVGPGRALGLDLSAPMLERARARAADEGVANVSFEHGDAQVHPLAPDSFDVAISRFGVMFFTDPVAAFTNVARALRPGGRVVFLSTAEPEGTEWLRAFGALDDILPLRGFGATGGPGMFSLADAGTATGLLTAAGFHDVRAERVQAYGTWGRDAEDAARFMLESGPGRHLLEQVDADARALAHVRLAERLRRHETPEGLRLRGAGRLLTARRPA